MIERLRRLWDRVQLELIISRSIADEQSAAKASEKAAIKRARKMLS